MAHARKLNSLIQVNSHIFYVLIFEAFPSRAKIFAQSCGQTLEKEPVRVAQEKSSKNLLLVLMLDGAMKRQHHQSDGF